MTFILIIAKRKILANKKFAWAHSYTRAESEGRSEVVLFVCNKKR